MHELAMKLALMMGMAVGAHASMTYECSFEATNAGLFHGTYVKVSADNKAEAERKARAKIKELRGKDTVIKYLRCR